METQHFSSTAHCRICRGSDLVELFSLGDHALSGRFPGIGEPDPPTAPLTMLKCDGCGLVQIRDSVDSGELYTPGYGYRSGISRTMRDHLAEVARWIGARSRLGGGGAVLDIGSNDGTLLSCFDAPGVTRVGVDPIIEKYADFYPPGVVRVADFFSLSSVAGVLPDAKAQVVTSLAMFYDLDDPHAFVADVANVLAEDGIWVLEQSYLPAMLETNAFDTICHEHLEYYGLRQIEMLTRAGGLRVFDVERNSCNGGSFRLAVCHAGGPYPENRAALGAMRGYEREIGLDGLDIFSAFFERVSAIRTRLVDLIETEHGAGRTIYAYGASTKGNTLLQTCGLDHTRIRAAADRNPEKWGRRTPGTAIPIVSEDQARSADPDYFLVLPWHFRDEFIEREAKFLARGRRLIFPLPDVEIV